VAHYGEAIGFLEGRSAGLGRTLRLALSLVPVRAGRLHANRDRYGPLRQSRVSGSSALPLSICIALIASLGNGQVAGSRNDNSPGIDCEALLACRLDSMA
jgi:hypothetical protein